MREETEELREENFKLRWSIGETRSVLEQFCRAYPDVVLTPIDAALDSVETNGACGSFSDFFEPVIHDAYNTGVSQEAINLRLDRLMALYNSGKPMSSYTTEFPEAFRADVERMRHLADQKGDNKETAPASES